MRLPLVLVLALTWTPGCGDDGGADRLQARFVLPSDTTAPVPVADMPYPNDAHLGADGVLAITEETLPFSDVADSFAVAHVAASLQQRDCFGVTSGASFPIDGTSVENPIDKATLVAPNVRFVNLDTGETLAVDTHFRPLEAHVSVRPVIGKVLTQGQTYAVLLTNDVLTAAGEPLATARDLSSLLAGTSPHPANAAYAPLRDYLTEQSIDPETIAGATVFTVCDLSTDFIAVQSQLDASAAPAATVTKVLSLDTELDTLLGTPVDNSYPGVDNPGGIAHASISHIVFGTYPSPNYQSDTPNLLGRWEYDGNGDPIAKGVDQVPYVLVLPDVASYVDVPVIVFQHGINGNRTQVLHVANLLASFGFATIGIDIPFHGDRFPNASDSFHNFTGAAGADGFADDSGASAALFFLDLIGDERVDWIDPSAMAASFQQGAVDMMVLARLLADGDWSALAATPGLSGFSFNGERIVFASESFGGIIGATAVAYEPRYGAAFLTVAGGGLIDRLLENSPVYGGLFMPILNGAMDISPSDVDPGFDPAHTHIAYKIMGPLLDAGDPIAHAARIIPAGKHVVMANAYSDESVPNQCTQALAKAMGLAWTQLSQSTVGPRFAEFEMLSGAVTGNDAGTTAVAFEYDPASHGMITRLKGKRRYEPNFPPTTNLPNTLDIDNPIVELQTQLATFARTYVDTGVPTLIDPFVD